MNELTKAVDMSLANELSQARKIIFDEAHILLKAVFNMNNQSRDEKDNKNFEAEMLRYISYLIKTTPMMTTVSPKYLEKAAIHMWLGAFKLQSYDVACSALMTTAVTMFTR